MQDKTYSLRLILKLTEHFTLDRLLNIAGVSPEQKQRFESGNAISLSDEGTKALIASPHAATIVNPVLSINHPLGKKNEPIEVLFKSGYRAIVNVVDDHIEDAIIIAKAGSINAGYANPKLAWIKDSKNVTVYYCSLCGKNPVTPESGEDTCYNCINS
jgi:hypothetical protein